MVQWYGYDYLMNVHHLELFYHVATHRGIGLAVRHMPYGIQQPAVSSQLIQLEKDLNTILFQRRPFALTAEGEQLYQFITPFFGNLAQMGRRLRGNPEPLLRLASTPTIIRNHLPLPLKELRKKFKGFKLAMREIEPNQAEPLLRNREIDVAISFWERQPVGGIKFQKLGSLNMALLVPEAAPFKSAEELLREAQKTAPGLISLAGETSLPHAFRQELSRRKIAWQQSIEVNSIDLIQAYVRDGFGYGLSVIIPGTPLPKGLKMLPLRGFPMLTIGLFWMGRKIPIVEAFSAEMQRYVTTILRLK
jgi:DNA-binding transcriptional LysR family regulator